MGMRKLGTAALSDIVKNYTRKDFIEMYIVRGYCNADVKKELRISTKTELQRVLDHFRIPKEYRRSEGLNPFSIAFFRYCHFLGLNLAEVNKLCKCKFKSNRDLNKHASAEMRVISSTFEVDRITRFREGPARPAKHFTNRYFLAPAIDGGFSMQELCRITWYNPKSAEEYLKEHRLFNFYQALMHNNTVSLAKKPCLVAGTGEIYRLLIKDGEDFV